MKYDIYNVLLNRFGLLKVNEVDTKFNLFVIYFGFIYLKKKNEAGLVLSI